MTGDILETYLDCSKQAGTSLLWYRVSRNQVVAMSPGIVLLPQKDVILMEVYVSIQSKYMPPCQWYLHNNASYPYHLQ